MMKRLISVILSAVLVLALAVPASAESPDAAVSDASAPGAPVDTDQRLAQVTAAVKSTLGIEKEYEEFYGELSENELCPVWSLNWSGEGEQLMVESTESGKILSYYLFDEADNSTSSITNFLPAFPAVSREQAQKQAEAFLKKVLDSSVETAQFSDSNIGRLSTSSHRFGGEIRLNGLSSPLTFSMTVRATDGKVTRFYRESLEQNTIGGVPSAKPGATQSAAGAQLKETIDLRLEYVLDPDSKEAALQYLPEPSDSYYVDAQTGKLVNLTRLFEEVDKKGFSNGMFSGDAGAAPEAAADTAASGGGLSQAELSGISKLEGVMDRDALDKALQKYAALGLSKYTLGAANYSLDKETGDVTVRLAYSRKDDNGTWVRIVTCNGKTGALLSVSSSAPYSETRRASVSEDAARKTAEAFLTELWGEDFARTSLYNSSAWPEDSWSCAHSFQFAQKENGYFFPENSLHIAVDITDGTISRLGRYWTEDVVFDSTDGILDKDAALDAWFSHYTVALAYRSIPVKLDPGMDGIAPLLEMGYSYFYSLKLSYALEEDKYASGVDAKSGQVLYRAAASSDGTLTYSDIADHWAKPQIETLAQYGIGWYGGTCQPRKELTQIDLIALLASTNGYRYDSEEDDAADNLYAYAYSLGILTRAERQDSKAMTRGETVKMLLNSAGFGRVAKLQGIFTSSYPDRDAIPAEMTGWAALAQGLGMVSADGDFAAGRTATRAEAVVMLCNLMNTFS